MITNEEHFSWRLDPGALNYLPMSQQKPAEILDTILGYLGFTCKVEEQEYNGHLVLQILTEDAERLIGQEEEVLQDLQFLVNRILQAHDRTARRVIIDVEHYRVMRDHAFIQRIKNLAEEIRKSGHSIQTDPLNSYDRRLVHHAFAEDPDLVTASPPDDARLKRVTIRLREKMSS